MIDPDSFKDVMGRFATGVSVVTFDVGDGVIGGLTASSFTSVSLDPPLILVCIGKAGNNYEQISKAGNFSVSFLAAEQTELAYAFANPQFDKSKLAHSRPESSPAIEDCLARMECSIWADHPAGDHAIIVGEVQSLEVVDNVSQPLLYYRGGITPGMF